MPAANQSTHRSGLGHVNLMVDTLIANASAEDLRAIARALLATSPVSTATAFTEAAQIRFKRTLLNKRETAACMFYRDARTDLVHSTPALHDLLRRARCLYGAGLGVESLHLLTLVVDATFCPERSPADHLEGAPHHENVDSIPSPSPADKDFESTLALIDADITQAIQSSKEQFGRGQISDVEDARRMITQLRASLEASAQFAVERGAEFPFEQGLGNLSYWKF